MNFVALFSIRVVTSFCVLDLHSLSLSSSSKTLSLSLTTYPLLQPMASIFLSNFCFSSWSWLISETICSFKVFLLEEVAVEKIQLPFAVPQPEGG